MSQKVTFTAGSAISKGMGCQVSGSTITPASGTAAPATFVAFEDVASGDVGAFYAPGSEQVYGIAQGAITGGDLVINSESVDGSFATVGTVSAGTSVNVAGVALTTAVDGGPVWISFTPYLYTEPV